ncbi:MAG: hypothetical protein KJ726_06220, partial [Verrucomicrobia bacterium]|nr:hypothetical protein [Verrucomicrobiota bacterium]
AEEAPRILKVTHRVRDSRRESPALMPSRLDTAPAGTENAGTEWFYVYWAPGRDGSLPGTVVTFEFRQAFRPLIRTLFIQYPFKVKGERCATFEIAESTIRRGGRVTAWRVRIVRGGRRLAERTSESWSQER